MHDGTLAQRTEIGEQRGTAHYPYRCPHCNSCDLRRQVGGETSETALSGMNDTYNKQQQRKAEQGRWYCHGCNQRITDDERIDMKGATDRSSSFYYGSQTE